MVEQAWGGEPGGADDPELADQLGRGAGRRHRHVPRGRRGQLDNAVGRLEPVLLLVHPLRLGLEQRARAAARKGGAGQRGDGVDDRPALRGVGRAADPLDGPADRVDDPADDLGELVLAVGLQQLRGELALLGRGQRRLVGFGLLSQHPQEDLVEELLLGLAGPALGGFALPVLALLVLAFPQEAAEQPAEHLAGDRDQRQEALLALALPILFLALPVVLVLALVLPRAVAGLLVLTGAMANLLILPRAVAGLLIFAGAVAGLLILPGAIASLLILARPISLSERALLVLPHPGLVLRHLRARLEHLAPSRAGAAVA